MLWGFPRQDGKGLLFNMRSESAQEKLKYRQGLFKPLVAPATGFYEWRGKKGHKEKFLFQAPCAATARCRENSPLLYLAGLWRLFANIPYFSILTRGADDFMRPFHHRMPVLIPHGMVQDWLAGSEPGTFWQLPSPALAVSAEVPAGNVLPGYAG